jgi:hypothetical protein
VRRGLLALLPLVLLVACGVFAGPSPTVVDSGIRGIVLLGPTCAAESPAGPCTTPYAAQIVILDEEDHEVARVTSGADGRFEVPLPPGQYTVAPVPGDPFPSAAPQDVTVVAGSFTEIEVNYDSGIR